MRYLILAMLVACTPTMTTHDYCVANADHYNSYNECYQERTTANQQAAYHAQKAGEAFSKAFAPQPTPPPQRVDVYTH